MVSGAGGASGQDRQVKASARQTHGRVVPASCRLSGGRLALGAASGVACRTVAGTAALLSRHFGDSGDTYHTVVVLATRLYFLSDPLSDFRLERLERRNFV